MFQRLIPIRQGIILLALFFIPSVGCAKIQRKNIQPQINSLVVAQRFDKAIGMLQEGPGVYSSNNELLYWLDKGMVLHLAGRYHDSAGAFEEAKRLYDNLYGRNVSEAVGAVVVNDYWQKYRGEDFEYILLNIFQSLNFAALGKFDEALADMRQVDFQLGLINARYSDKHKNVYRDSAWARLLAGIYYEAQGDSQSLNDAYIANQKAFQVYEEDYKRLYQVESPALLKANLLSMAEAMGDEALNTWKGKVKDVDFKTVREKQEKAEVYVFQYTGYVPVKVADAIVLPVDMRHVAKLSFPKLAHRFSELKSSQLIVKGNKSENRFATQVVEDIGAIADKVLENRKAWMRVKGVLRPALKYGLERTAEEAARRQGGETAQDIVALVGNVYNLATDEADVRSWATLPHHIRVVRVLLEPGEYEVFLDDLDEMGKSIEQRPLGKLSLKAGEKKVLISRSYR